MMMIKKNEKEKKLQIKNEMKMNQSIKEKKKQRQIITHQIQNKSNMDMDE